MPSSREQLTDETVERFLGTVLRVGVIASALIVAIGGGEVLWRRGAAPMDHKSFHGEPSDLRHPAGIVHAALSGQAGGVIALGLLLLMATPVVRVASSAVLFAWQRDYLYVGLTVFVLLVLVFSFWGASLG